MGNDITTKNPVSDSFLSCSQFCRVPLLQALIGLFELPEDDSIPDDEHFIEIEDTPGGLKINYNFLNVILKETLFAQGM